MINLSPFFLTYRFHSQQYTQPQKAYSIFSMAYIVVLMEPINYDS